MSSETDQLDINSIVKEHGALIKRLCKAYIGNGEDLEDLYQEVLINIWSSIKSFRNQSKLSTWIYRVTVNTAITFRKKRDRKSRLEKEIHPEDLIGNDPLDKSLKIEMETQISRLQKAIDCLENIDKLIIGLVLESVSYKEIAEVIGKDVNFVGVKITRIKSKLQKLMSNQNPHIL